MENNDQPSALQPANPAQNGPTPRGFKILQRKKPQPVAEEKAQEVLDSWEDFGEGSGSGIAALEALQRARQEKLLVAEKSRQEAKKLAESSANTTVVVSGPSGMHRCETAPAAPSLVKIMKRPDKNVAGPAADDSKDDSKVSLEDREKAYAEARMRIFGVAEAPPVSDEEGLSPSDLALKKEMSGLNLQEQFDKQLDASNSTTSTNSAGSKKKKKKKRNKSPEEIVIKSVEKPLPIQLLPTTRLMPAKPRPPPLIPRPPPVIDNNYGRPPAHLMHRVQSCPDTTRPPPMPARPAGQFCVPAFPPAGPVPPPPANLPGGPARPPNLFPIQGQYYPPQFTTWKQ